MKIQDLASSNALKKYMTILDRHSQKYKQSKAYFRKHHTYTVNELDVILDKVLKKLFIPCIEKNRSYLLACFHAGKPIEKFRFHDCLVPCEVKISEPSIVIQITDHISHKEWKEIWPEYRKTIARFQKKIKQFPDTLKEIKKPYFVGKGWVDIDLYLDIAQLRINKKYKYPEIADTLKNNNKYPYAKNRNLTYEQIGKKFRFFYKLIKSL